MHACQMEQKLSNQQMHIQKNSTLAMDVSYFECLVRADVHPTLGTPRHFFHVAVRC